MKYYITSRALTKGIVVVEGKICTTSSDMIEVVKDEFDEKPRFSVYYHKPFFYKSYEAAAAHARKTPER